MTPGRRMKYNQETLTVSLLPGAEFAIDPLTPVQLAILTLPLLGLAMVRACLFALTTPYLEELGLHSTYARALWIALPVSGVVTTPIVGYLSDHCGLSYGRRRPFIALGLVVGSIGILMFSFTGSLLFRKYSITARSLSAACYVVGVFGFQIVQTPLRALIADVAIPSQQVQAQALGTWMMGVGRGFGNVLVYFIVRATRHSMHKIMTVAVGVAILSALPCLMFTKEISIDGLIPERSLLQVLKFTGAGIRAMPAAMKKLCMIQMLAWLAFFCFVPIASEFLQAHMCDENRDQGVELYAFGMMVASIVETLAAAITPFLLSVTSFQMLYSIGFAVLTGSLIALSLVSSRTIAIGLLGATGLAYSFTNTFPYLLIGTQFGEKNDVVGLFVGALDACVYLPMFIDVTYTSFIRLDLCLQIGAGWAALATIAGIIIRPPPGTSRRREIMV